MSPTAPGAKVDSGEVVRGQGQGQGQGSAKLRVTNLPSEVQKEDLEKLFAQFGKVIQVDINTASSGRSWATLILDSESAATLAISELDQKPPLDLRVRPMANLDVNGNQPSKSDIKNQEAPVPPCIRCSKPFKLRCSRCRTARYCSLICQANDWAPSHVKDCNQEFSKNANSSDSHSEVQTSDKQIQEEAKGKPNPEGKCDKNEGNVVGEETFLRYRPEQFSKLPVGDGLYELVITHIEVPNIFVTSATDYTSYLETFSPALMSWADECKEKSFAPERHMACLAKASDGEWYRGYCLNDATEGKVIYFVDYGFQETVLVENLRKLNDDLVKPKHVVMPCVIKGFENKTGREVLPQLVEELSKLSDTGIVTMKAVGKWEDKTIVVIPALKCTVQESLRQPREANEEVNVWYKKEQFSKLPVQKDAEEVVVIHVEAPKVFVANVKEYQDFFETLFPAVQEYASRCRDEPFTPRKDMACLAKASDDVWYRGQCIDDAPKEKKEKVIYFVDYGFQETVLTTNIRKLSTEFLTPNHVAMPCILKGCENLKSGSEKAIEINHEIDQLAESGLVSVIAMDQREGKTLITIPALKLDMVERSESPKTENPKTENPKTENPKTENPKTENPKTENPKTESSKTESPKTESPKTESPKTEQITDRDCEENKIEKKEIVTTNGINKEGKKTDSLPNPSKSPPSNVALEDPAYYYQSEQFSKLSFTNDLLEVVVVHVEMPNVFVTTATEFESYDENTAPALESWAKQSQNEPFVPQKHMACMAKSSDDNAWYRGHCLGDAPDGKIIYFVDYGFQEIVPLSNLRKLCQPLLKLRHMARRCVLQGFETCKGTSEEGAKLENEVNQLAEAGLVSVKTVEQQMDKTVIVIPALNLSPPLNHYVSLSEPKSNERKIEKLANGHTEVDKKNACNQSEEHERQEKLKEIRSLVEEKEKMKALFLKEKQALVEENDKLKKSQKESESLLEQTRKSNVQNAQEIKALKEETDKLKKYIQKYVGLFTKFEEEFLDIQNSNVSRK